MDNNKSKEIKGIFNKAGLSSSGIFSVAVGVIIALIFDSMYSKNDTFSEKAFVLSFVFLGVLLFVFGLVILISNGKSYLTVSDDILSARYPIFRKLKCAVSDIRFVQCGGYIITIILKNGKGFKISGLINAKEIRDYLAEKIVTDESGETKEELEAMLEDGKKKYKRYISAMLVLIFVNFLLIGATAFMTGAMELSEFGKKENTIFAVFLLLTVLNFAAIFVITGKAAKLKTFLPEKSNRLRRMLITSAPLPPGNPIKVYTDDNYFGRITIFSMPGEESVYYVAEVLDEKYKLKKQFESEIYESIDKLSEITESFNEIHIMGL